MGQYRAAFEAKKSPEVSGKYHFEPAADLRDLARAEKQLGLPIPEQLRRFYLESGGIWWGSKFPTDTETWIVLPPRLLAPAKDYIANLWYATDIEGWSAEFAKCVVYTMPEHGASFWFMTKAKAWGIPRGRAAKWDHDGDVYDPGWDLKTWLREYGNED